MKEKIKVRTPASSANLGPGFDCLGMALGVFNELTLEITESGLEIEIRGEGEDSLPRDRSNLVARVIDEFFPKLLPPEGGLRISLQNTIPVTRGMGSSSATIVGSLMAANELAGRPFSREDLHALATRYEGHPDNVTPAFLGGLTVAVMEDDKVFYTKVPFSPMHAVLFVPNFSTATAKARQILPSRVDRRDAVYNVGRAALLVAALSTNQPHLLAVATEDRLHQPYREQLFPQMQAFFQAALQAGARGAFLSGAGSTILALADEGEQEIADAMAATANSLGVGGRTLVTEISPMGCRIIP